MLGQGVGLFVLQTVQDPFARESSSGSLPPRTCAYPDRGVLSQLWARGGFLTPSVCAEQSGRTRVPLRAGELGSLLTDRELSCSRGALCDGHGWSSALKILTPPFCCLLLTWSGLGHFAAECVSVFCAFCCRCLSGRSHGLSLGCLEGVLSFCVLGPSSQAHRECVCIMWNKIEGGGVRFYALAVGQH